MSATPDPRIGAELVGLHHSDQRFLRTVDSLPSEDWQAPSLLPGWTRCHVIAHLALNAEGFAGALEAIDRGTSQPIYPSDAGRDAGIETLAARPTDEIRERVFAATARLRHAFAGLTGSQWDGTVLRLPEGPAWPTTALVGARWREVEIHHADLGTSYTHHDWPTDFAISLLDQVTRDRIAAGGDPFTVRAADLDRTWSVGADAPVVEGTVTELGWWLTGRGDASALVADALPRLGAWRRAPD